MNTASHPQTNIVEDTPQAQAPRQDRRKHSDSQRSEFDHPINPPWLEDLPDLIRRMLLLATEEGGTEDEDVADAYTTDEEGFHKAFCYNGKHFSIEVGYPHDRGGRFKVNVSAIIEEEDSLNADYDQIPLFHLTFDRRLWWVDELKALTEDPKPERKPVPSENLATMKGRRIDEVSEVVTVFV